MRYLSHDYDSCLSYHVIVHVAIAVARVATATIRIACRGHHFDIDFIQRFMEYKHTHRHSRSETGFEAARPLRMKASLSCHVEYFTELPMNMFIRYMFKAYVSQGHV